MSTGPKTSRPRPSLHQDKSAQQRTGATNSAVFADEPPQSASMTDYDRQHLTLYVRLLDAAEEGAEWTEVARVLFGLDPKRDGDGGERGQALDLRHRLRSRRQPRPWRTPL